MRDFSTTCFAQRLRRSGATTTDVNAEITELKRKIEQVEGEIEQVEAALGLDSTWSGSTNPYADAEKWTRDDLKAELGRLRDNLTARNGAGVAGLDAWS